MASEGARESTRRLVTSAAALAWIAAAVAVAACSSRGGETASHADAGGSAEGASGAIFDAGAVGEAAAPEDARGGGAADAADAGGSAKDAAPAPTCITPTTPQSCRPPQGTALPICALSQTGCVDPKHPTQLAAGAIPYEVNSPLWSDGAAKTRAFFLPDGGAIHVKNCTPDAGAAALAECVSPQGIANGAAETGKWVLPVGTVMVKNFLFDGKLVETRLLMRVDAATAAIVQNGSDWVGFNYAWNEQQTEATVVPDARTSVEFDTGTRKVTWNYPNFIDCIGCHAPAVGAIGPETDQMNREVDGGNQIDLFEAMHLFDDTAPTKPYAAPMVEPYANASLGLSGPPSGATVDEEARSYLAANCGFCHRPDVNDQGFDLRYALTMDETGLCGLTQQNGIPGMTNQTYLDLSPGNHAASALWMRMNIAVPASDSNETADVGRMPSVGSFVVDTQATALVGSWIDGLTACPGADAGP